MVAKGHHMDSMTRTKLATVLVILGSVWAASVLVAQQRAPILDIQGVYNHRGMMSEDRATIFNDVGGGVRVGDYTGFPLNDAGRQWADSWMAARTEMPEHQCEPHPGQYLSWGPGHFRITNIFDPRTERIIGMTLQGANLLVERTLWLDGRSRPPEYARHTWAGFSLARWEGNMLTVDTTHLKEGWFNRNGISSSDKTTMREHYIRHGNYLTVIFIVNDPDHLEEPFIRTTQAVLDATTQLGPSECQPFNASVINASQPRGYVPHWLPGQNPQLTEFSERFGVPYEAARGGAKTLYPEYVAEIKKWIDARPQDSAAPVKAAP
jgi:hypothetical protein